MAQSGIIKVTTKDLVSTANKFEQSATTVSTIKDGMMSLIDELSSDWTGTASTTYAKKFKGLESDIRRMIARIKEHNKDLIDMANVYATTEEQNISTGNNLSSNFLR